MTRVRDTLTPEQRAEWDALIADLSDADQRLVRLVEIFMIHEMNQAAMFNEEIRHYLDEVHTTLRIVSRRLSELEGPLVRRVGDYGAHEDEYNPVNVKGSPL